MFPPGLMPGDALAFLGGIDPASQAAGTYTTGAIAAAQHNVLWFVLNDGAIGTGGSLQLSILAGPTSGGAFAAVAGLSAIPPITVAGNKVLYGVRTDLLASAGVGPYVKGQVVVAGTTNSVFSLEVYGGMERYGPASDWNAGAVQAAVNN